MRRKLKWQDRWIVGDFLTRIMAAMVKGDVPMAIMVIGEMQGFGRGVSSRTVAMHIHDVNAALIDWYNAWAQTHPMQ